MLKRSAALAAIFLVAGCIAPTDEVEGSEDEVSSHPQATVCFSGRSLGSDPYASGGNSQLGDLCKSLPNLVRDTGGRDADYPFFRWNSDVDHALDVVVAFLDTNHDVVVTNLDTPYDLDVIGFSWGGFNARELVAKIGTDRRFSPSRHAVARFIALDPFRTTKLVIPETSLDVPANVQSFWEFRHTIAPADDCSRIAWGLVGPFTGRDPRCTGTTACRDFDYSQRASTLGVDHCDVPGRSTAAVRRIVSGRTPADLPPERTVARY